MQDPLRITLELARASQAEDPFAFRPRAQDYILRVGRGQYRTVTLPWKGAVMDDLVALRGESPDPAVAQRLGTVLRTFLLDAGWEQSEEQIAEAVQQGRPVRITMLSGAAELYALPWELLTVGATGERLAQLPGVLLTYEWPGSRVAKASGKGHRVLFAWSGAGGRVPFARHAEALDAAVASLKDSGGDADVVVLADAGRAALADALEQAEDDGRPFRHLHLLCHGDARGDTLGLLLDGPDGQPDFVDPNELQQVIGPSAGPLETVVLCACLGGSAGSLDNPLGSVALALHRGSTRRGGVPAVLSSRTLMRFDVAELVTRRFYRELLAGSGSVDEAFLSARDAVARRIDGPEYAWLQLYQHGAEVAPAASAGPDPDLMRTLDGATTMATALVRVEADAPPRALPVAVTSVAGDGSTLQGGPASPALVPVIERALQQARSLHGKRVTQQWRLDAPRGVATPEQVGAAAAMAALCSATGRELPAGWAFVGGLDDAGRPLPTPDLAAALEAAAGQGVRHVGVLMPPGAAVVGPAGVTVHAAGGLKQLTEAVWPPRKPTRVIAAGVTALLVVLVVLLRITDPLDLSLQAWVLNLVNGPIPARTTVIVDVPFDEVSDPRELRARHDDLIDALVAAGVRSIGFDVAFSTPDERDDEFAAGIARARAAGVPVTIGVRHSAGELTPPGSPVLAEHAELGLVRLETEGFKSVSLGRVVARKDTPDHGTVWSLGINALHGRTGFANEPALSEDGLLLGGQVHPVDMGRLYIHPAEQSPTVSYDDPGGSGVDLADKVVLVGAFVADDSFMTPLGRRYGVELHAALIESLVAQVVPRRMGRLHNLLMVGLVGGLGFGLVTLLRGRWRLVAVVAPLAGVAWVLVRASVGVSTDLSPILLAGVVGPWVALELARWREGRLG